MSTTRNDHALRAAIRNFVDRDLPNVFLEDHAWRLGAC
jgi:hypothetical protein